MIEMGKRKKKMLPKPNVNTPNIYGRFSPLTLGSLASSFTQRAGLPGLGSGNGNNSLLVWEAFSSMNPQLAR